MMYADCGMNNGSSEICKWEEKSRNSKKNIHQRERNGGKEEEKHKDKNMTSVVSFLFRSLLQVKIATAPL